MQMITDQEKRKLLDILDEISITVNKQIIPDDPNPPLKPSGIRLGTPCATTRPNSFIRSSQAVQC